MRPIVFVLGLLVVLYNLRLNPAWAAAAAGYFYFAIPMREYNMPSAPYQAAFFALAIVLSTQTRYFARMTSRTEIFDRALEATRTVVTLTREVATSTLAAQALASGGRARSQGSAMEAAVAEIDRLVPRYSPRQLIDVVRGAATEILRRALEEAGGEAERVLELALQDPTRSKGALDTSVREQIDSAFDRRTKHDLKPVLSAKLEAAIAHYEATRHDRPRQLREHGILGVPLHRPGFIAVVSNAGIWAHLLFTIGNYISTANARWSQAVAAPQIEVCWLLFIPMIGIIAGVRNAKQFRLFTMAWVLGVAHICYNGLMLWLTKGGRADDVGGQQGDANFLGIIAVSVAPVALAGFLSEKNRFVAFSSLGLAGLCALGVLAGGSRGAMISATIGIAYWFFWTNKKGVATGLILLALSGFVAMAPASFWERMQTVFREKTSNPYVVVRHEESADSRKRAWALAIQVFKEEPIHGIGPKNFRMENLARRVALTNDGTAIETHSTWLQLLSELGLVGAPFWYFGYFFSFFCMLRAFLVARAFRDDPRYGWLSTYFLGFQAGWISNALAITFVSCQWLDFNYWIFIWGPLALQIARETRDYVEWFQVPGSGLEARPPPRYSQPTAEGLDLDGIQLAGTPALASADLVRAAPDVSPSSGTNQSR